MKRVIIVQARMGSTRLPGKVLMEVGGLPMLAQQVQRLRQFSQADEIVIATTTDSGDEAIVTLARKMGIAWYCGSEDDVLRRYVGAAKQAKADIVVRVTADCPLIDPEVGDRVIRELIKHSGECDYASNVLKRTYPHGLDVEAMFLDTLLRLDRLSLSPAAREHVTTFLRAERPELFLSRSLEDTQNNADLRWTVDEERDLKLIRRLYAELHLGERQVSYREIISHVRASADLASFNMDVKTWQPDMKAI
jgi:spore coat polysaccharide biosynthesis protein SpsF